MAPRLVLDSGGLSALANGEPRALAWAFRATQQGMLYGIPAPVLAETITGQPQDAKVYRVFSSPDLVIETTADIARLAGLIRFRAKFPDKTVDALVVSSASQYPHSIVLTSDPADLTFLASQSPRNNVAIRSVNSLPKKS
jgi:hypothetical protein